MLAIFLSIGCIAGGAIGWWLSDSIGLIVVFAMIGCGLGAVIYARYRGIPWHLQSRDREPTPAKTNLDPDSNNGGRDASAYSLAERADIEESADTPLDALCKIFIDENYYSILGTANGDTVTPSGVSLNDDYAWPAADIAELAPLADHFEVVLFQDGSSSLDLICIKNRLFDGSDRVSMSIDAIEEIGRNWREHAEEVHDTQIPVRIQVWEVTNSSDAEFDHLRALQSGPNWNGNVAVTSWSLNFSTLAVRSTAGLGGLFSGRRSIEKALVAAIPEKQSPRRKALAIGYPDQRPIMTFMLLGIMGVVFILQLILGEYTYPTNPTSESLFSLGGLNRDAILEYGQWYRLVSSAFLHADFFHLALNGVALYLGGILLESILGRPWFLTTFALSLLGGSLASLLFNGSNVVSVGASGAIMGMLATAFTITFKLPDDQSRAVAQVHLLYWLVPALIPLAESGSEKPIDFAGHIGGAIAGFAVGAFILKTWKPNERLPNFYKPALLFGGTSVVFFYLSLVQAYINRT